MHIAEGFLPVAHCIAWGAASMPFVAHGAYAVRKQLKENPETGLLLGAAGALEAAICYTALVENAGKAEDDIVLPKHVWDGVRDKELPLLNIAGAVGAKRTGRVKICVSNSFAFGGANASLVLGRGELWKAKRYVKIYRSASSAMC